MKIMAATMLATIASILLIFFTPNPTRKPTSPDPASSVPRVDKLTMSNSYHPRGFVVGKIVLRVADILPLLERWGFDAYSSPAPFLDFISFAQ